MSDCIYTAAHERAFSVAAAMPERFLTEVSCLIGQLLETAASFDEAKTALQPLIERFRETPLEPA